MTMCGFPSMAGTILDEVLRFQPEFIEHQLTHAVRDADGPANHRMAVLQERRRMMHGMGRLSGPVPGRRKARRPLN